MFHALVSYSLLVIRYPWALHPFSRRPEWNAVLTAYTSYSQQKYQQNRRKKDENATHIPFANPRVCKYACIVSYVCVCVVKPNVSGWCLNINKIQAHNCTRPTLSLQRGVRVCVLWRRTPHLFIFTHPVIGTHLGWPHKISCVNRPRLWFTYYFRLIFIQHFKLVSIKYIRVWVCLCQANDACMHAAAVAFH